MGVIRKLAVTPSPAATVLTVMEPSGFTLAASPSMLGVTIKAAFCSEPPGAGRPSSGGRSETISSKVRSVICSSAEGLSKRTSSTWVSFS